MDAKLIQPTFRIVVPFMQGVVPYLVSTAKSIADLDFNKAATYDKWQVYVTHGRNKNRKLVDVAYDCFTEDRLRVAQVIKSLLELRAKHHEFDYFESDGPPIIEVASSYTTVRHLNDDIYGGSHGH